MEVKITNYEKQEKKDTDLTVRDDYRTDMVRLTLNGKVARVKASELYRAIKACS